MSAALRSYTAYVSEIQELSDFVDRASDLKRKIWGLVDQHALTTEARHELTGFTEIAVDARDRVSSAFFLVAQAGFEQYVAERITEFVRTIQLSYVDLKGQFPNAADWNIRLAGIALSRIHDAPSHWNLDVDQVLTDLATSVGSSKKVVLQARLLATGSSKIDADEMDRVLQRISRKLNWNAISSEKSLQEVLGTKGNRETEKAVRERLKQHVRWRNALAHTQGLNLRVGWDELQRSLRFFTSFAAVLDKNMPTR